MIGWLPGRTRWARRFAREARRTRDAELRAYYATGPVPSHTPLAETPFLALDLETSGLDPRRDRVLSIGWVELSLAGIACQSARYHLIENGEGWSESTVPIHGLTHDTLARHGWVLEYALRELLTALRGRVGIVHHAPIERGFLNACLQGLGMGRWVFPVIDTLRVERRWLLHRGPLPEGQNQHSLRLDDTRRVYGLPRYKAHHALTDAIACAELWLAQARYHYTPETPIRKVWS